MDNTYRSDIPAFELYDDLYFVGSSKVSVHVLKTTEGLVMIDTGFPSMYEQILHSMREVGLDPTALRAIIHSHGHIDHVGCTARLKAISGAVTCISRIDNAIVNGTLDLSWAKELGLSPLAPFDADVLLEDENVLRFGDTVIRCRLTPGHTDGVLSFFIEHGRGERRIRAAMHGGVGMNSMTAAYLTANSMPYSCRDRFREGLHALADEPVDLVLGNHPEQNDTVGKRATVLAGGSPLDHTQWQRFLKETEKTLDHMIQAEQNG